MATKEQDKKPGTSLPQKDEKIIRQEFPGAPENKQKIETTDNAMDQQATNSKPETQPSNETNNNPER